MNSERFEHRMETMISHEILLLKNDRNDRVEIARQGRGGDFKFGFSAPGLFFGFNHYHIDHGNGTVVFAVARTGFRVKLSLEEWELVR